MNPNEKNIISDDLLAKFFAGDITQIEKDLIENWKKSNVENQKYFSNMKIIWEKSETNNKTIFDSDLAWKSVQSRIEKKSEPNKIINLKRDQVNYDFILRIAASIIVLAGCALAYYVIIGKDETEKFSEIKVSTKQNILNDTLPDGTFITLNKNSVLSYNTGFGKDNRTVTLQGEAYFIVNHQTENNFTVLANNIVVRDIGTAFNINTKNAIETEVVITEGSVIFKAEKDSILLVKGNKIKYNKLQKKIIKETNTEINFDAYRTKTLVFERTEMYKVVELLNEIYNIKINIANENFKGCKLTATFKNESLETILEIIEATFAIKASKTETGITLEGSGCSI